MFGITGTLGDHSSVTSKVYRHTSFNSPLLHSLACDAAARCGTLSFEALSVVILSATALEAFLGEILQLAITLEKEPPAGRVTMSKFVTKLLKATEGRRAPFKRYKLASEQLAKLPGSTSDDGMAEQRSSVETLFALRNAIAHLKSEEIETVHFVDPEIQEKFDGYWLGELVTTHGPGPDCLARVEEMDLLVQQDADGSLRWVDRICTKKIATWACRVAADASEALVNCAPDSAFRTQLQEESMAGFNCGYHRRSD